MPISVAPIIEPVSHKHATHLATSVNQVAIIVKNMLANGAPASGNDPAIPAAEIKQHFSAGDLANLETIAKIA